ncbi:RNA polymerase sigma factor RpoS, partial [Enterobacter hormaechei]|nr:RNA polymerase sigma factor RpoS [Enterobacter hormaechei]
MSQNTLKVNELYDDADLDESGIEADDFDEKLLKNDGDDLTDFENDLDVLQGMSQR